jgi:hypothetical protein
MCVAVNNVETARLKLGDIDDELNGALSEVTQEIFRFLKGAVKRLIGVIVYRVSEVLLTRVTDWFIAQMNEVAFPLIKKLVDSKKLAETKQLSIENVPAVRELLEYLDSQVTHLIHSTSSVVLVRRVGGSSVSITITEDSQIDVGNTA